MFLNNINVLCLIMCFTDFSRSLPYDNLNHTNIYGNDYGTKWIYFPNGDGIPHYVNLRTPENGINFDMRRPIEGLIEFRLYIGNDTYSYIELNEIGQPYEKIYQNTTMMILSSHKPLKIITHGWKSSADKEGVVDIKTAYLETKDVKVITIDWSEVADSIFYPWVAYEAKGIGATVAKFISALHKRYNITGKQFHLIGHSLGAHIMGIAASRSNFTVDRITGLDPARPLFEYPSFEGLEKLDPTDADFVDIIHTCRGVLGYEAPTGTVDFYPNNGFPPQPGCGSIQKIFEEKPCYNTTFVFTEACSHGRSFYYFSESIKYPEAFPAYQCHDWFEYLGNRCSNYSYMGESVDRKLTGNYYLKTNSHRPYGFHF